MTGFSISNTSNIKQPTSLAQDAMFGGVQEKVGIFPTGKKKIELTQEDIGAMAFCAPPLDPNNEEQVKIWLNMPEAEKDLYRTAYIASVSETPTEGTIVSDASAKPQESQAEAKPQKMVELPENWSNMSAEAKTQFIFNLLGEMKYGENWHSMPDDAKEKVIEEQLIELTNISNSEFKKMNVNDRAKAVEDTYLKLAAILKDFDGKSIGNGELKAAYSEFNALPRTEQSKKISQVHEELHVVIHHDDHEVEHEEGHYKVHHERNAANRIEREFYVKLAEKLGCTRQELTEQQKLEAFEELANDEGKLPPELEELQSVYNSLKFKSYLLKSGKITDKNGSIPTYSLQDTIDADFVMLTKKNGEKVIDQTKDTNVEIICNKVRQFKTGEEFLDWLNGLSDVEQNFVLKSIQDSSYGLNREEFDRLNLKEHLGIDYLAVLYSSGRHSSLEAQNLGTDIAMDMRDQLDANHYHELASKHNSKDAQEYLGQKSLESGDTAWVGSYNQYTALREDALDLFKGLNEYANQSDTITDEMKEFYAQNSIESLQTPEQRAAQAEDLKSYNNKSFDTGVDTGLANVARGETPTVNQNNNEIVSQQSNDANLTLSESAQQVYDSIEKMLQGNLDSTEVKAKFAGLEPNEQINLMRKYAAVEGNKINVKVCNYIREFVPILVELGKGLEIVEKCSMQVGDYAISLLPRKDKKLIAIKYPQRLAYASYQALIEDGTLKPGEHNKTRLNVKS